MISLIITSYGRPYHLRLCLKSIRHQLHQDLIEIVISDDGTPGTEPAKIAKEYDAKFVGNNHTENLGFILNRGIEKSTGDDLILLSHCMVLSDDYINKIVKCGYSLENTITYGEIVNISEPDKDNKVKLLERRDRKPVVTFDEIFNPLFELARTGAAEQLTPELDPHWAVADGLDAVIKKDLWEKFPFSEDFDVFPTHSYVEWLARLWINRVKYNYCPDLLIFHQGHPFVGDLSDDKIRVNYQKNINLYRAKLTRSFKEVHVELTIHPGESYHE